MSFRSLYLFLGVLLTHDAKSAVSIVVNTGGLSLVASQSRQFNAAVTGVSDTTVSWSVVPNTGSVGSTGVYTAPASISTAQTVQLIATSHADPTKSASVSISLVPGAVVVLTPGTNLETAVAQQPAGTTFLLKAGLYRLQSVPPKNNDTFIGEPSVPTAQGVGTVVSGAKVLTGFVSSGPYWVVKGQTQKESQYGPCAAAHPMCGYTDDLFLDNNVLTRVAALRGMTTGQWYFDTTGGNIYMADNPAGHTIETSITPVAFFGPARGVTISGLTVEKYACPAQFGAIGNQYPAPGWIVKSSEIRWNHGTGLSLNSDSQALNNFIHHNGQKGLGVGYWEVPATNVTVSGNEISFNNYAGFDPGWEAGGTKFWQTTNLVVTGNNVHDNLGSGLWTDTDNVNTIYDGNTVTNNQGPGIQHEVSFSAIIRNNTVEGNGPNPGNWLWQSQILIQNSQNVQVYNNTVVATATNGNGIGVINQNRGSSKHLGLPWAAINNYIHDNDVTYYAGSKATSGIVADYNASQALNGTNRFDNNHYHVVMNPSHPQLWQWNRPVTWSDWQAAGQDVHGTVDAKIRPTAGVLR